jgi:hypothetical protein
MTFHDAVPKAITREEARTLSMMSAFFKFDEYPEEWKEGSHPREIGCLLKEYIGRRDLEECERFYLNE